MKTNKTSLIVILGMTVIGLSACGSSHTSSSDPGGNPGSRQAVIQMPYGFRNVAFSCHGTTGVYVTSRSVTANVELPSSIAVLANDPSCR